MRKLTPEESAALFNELLEEEWRAQSENDPQFRKEKWMPTRQKLSNETINTAIDAIEDQLRASDSQDLDGDQKLYDARRELLSVGVGRLDGVQRPKRASRKRGLPQPEEISS